MLTHFDIKSFQFTLTEARCISLDSNSAYVYTSKGNASNWNFQFIWIKQTFLAYKRRTGCGKYLCRKKATAKKQYVKKVEKSARGSIGAIWYLKQNYPTEIFSKHPSPLFSSENKHCVEWDENEVIRMIKKNNVTMFNSNCVVISIRDQLFLNVCKKNGVENWFNWKIKINQVSHMNNDYQFLCLSIQAIKFYPLY